MARLTGPAGGEVERACADLARGVTLTRSGAGPDDGAWLQVQQDDLFRRMRHAGFTAVRLPIDFSAAQREGNAPGAPLDPAWIQRIERLVKMAQRMDLATVLAAFPRGDTDDDAARRRFREDWRQVAAHFADAPGRMYYEIHEGPDSRLSADDWSLLADEVLRALRAEDPDQVLILGAPHRGDPARLSELRLPDDPGCIVSFVYEEPRAFTRQGDPVLRGSDAWLGTSWAGGEEERARVAADLARAAAWSRQTGRRIFCSSFGSTGHADPQSRINWTFAVARGLEANGIPWCYAAFDGADGIYDDIWHIWRQPLTGALLNR